MTSPAPRCTVWWAAPVDPDGAPALVRLLDAGERDQLTRFRRPADRARYLAAHALVRLVLGGDATSAAALRFDRTCRCGAAHGKPVLPGGPGFSLTHAGAVVGVAVRPDGAVGLDVEQVRAVADLLALAGHVYSRTELARTPTPDQAAFFRTWTRKEALLKATGDGLAAPMSAITLSSGGVVEAWTDAADDGDEDTDARGAGPTGDGRTGDARTGDGSAPVLRHGPMWLRDLTAAPDHPAAVAGPGGLTPEVVEADGDAVLHG